MSREELLRQLLGAADDLEDVATPPAIRDQLVAMCESARRAFGAAAVSIARVVDDELVYEASAGEGAEAVVGVRLPVGRGIAGFVAQAGQALAVDRLENDPRFARDVAESTGYIPTTILASPVLDRRGEVVGVVSVLDRDEETGGAAALALAASVASQAALLLPLIDTITRLGELVIAALASSVAGDPADAMEVIATPGRAGDEGLLAVVARLPELSSDDREAVDRLLRAVIDLTTSRRR